MDLITLQEYKNYVGISSTNQDTLISTIIGAVSQLVKSVCNRTFVDYSSSSKIEYFDNSIGGVLYLSETPVIAVSGVERSQDYGVTWTDLLEDTEWAAAGDRVVLIPAYLRDVVDPRSFKITYTGGYTVLPSDLKIAVLDLVTYYLKSDNSVHSSRSVGSNTTQIEYITTSNLPSHIRRVLDLYRDSYL